MVLEKALESLLDFKEIQPVHPKEDQSWVFTGRTDAEAETPILWLPHAKSWLIRKDSDAGRDWGQEEKGTTEDETASLTPWTWVWVNSGSWWWTVRPGVLPFMGSQRVGHDWVTELNWTDLCRNLTVGGSRLLWGMNQRIQYCTKAEYEYFKKCVMIPLRTSKNTFVWWREIFSQHHKGNFQTPAH